MAACGPSYQESAIRSTSRPRHARRVAALAAALAIVASAMIGSGTSVASNSRGCAYDRPCIDDAYYTTARNIYVTWTATEDFDDYNVRWSRPGKAPVQVEVGGGRTGRFKLRNVHAWTTYQVAIQGCNTQFLGPSECSPWEPAQVKVRSFTP